MNHTTEFLVRHGLPLIFAAVFVDQMGVPIPAVPWLLAAGALSATGKFNLGLGLGVTVVACLIADAIWFYLGRYRGHQVLGLLCRIALEPDSCVRRTQNVFSRYGLRGVLLAKFLPGMSTVAPPLAGMSKVSAARFLFVDGVGSLLYAGCFLGAGYLFSYQIDQIGASLARIGGSALSLLIGVVVLFIVYKYWQRQRLLHELRMARITVAELRELLDAGKAPLIFDLRSKAAVEEDPALIQGAVHLSMEEIETRISDFPKDRDIIVYCSCPNEVSSARLALRLQRKGFTRVRPLLGGLDAWREQNYPLQQGTAVLTVAAESAAPAGPASSGSEGPGPAKRSSAPGADARSGTGSTPASNETIPTK
jgi:membrane protein DedA with SNARE-associated domain/rhodanese-related sulfurtransferase